MCVPQLKTDGAGEILLLHVTYGAQCPTGARIPLYPLPHPHPSGGLKARPLPPLSFPSSSPQSRSWGRISDSCALRRYLGTWRLGGHHPSLPMPSPMLVPCFSYLYDSWVTPQMPAIPHPSPWGCPLLWWGPMPRPHLASMPHFLPYRTAIGPVAPSVLSVALSEGSLVPRCPQAAVCLAT